MAHRFQLFIMFMLVLLLACSSVGTDLDTPPGGTGDDTGSSLYLELYRFGTDFRAVSQTADDDIVLVGSGGILILKTTESDRFVPVGTGVANNLNSVLILFDRFTVAGEGLTPGEPGIIRDRSFDSGEWTNVDHPARGGFTDLNGSAAVTTLGEVLTRDIQGVWTVDFEDPGGVRLEASKYTTEYVTAMGSGGRIYRNENPKDMTTWISESITSGPDFRDITAVYDMEDLLGHVAYAVGDREIWRRVDGDWEQTYTLAGGELYSISRHSGFVGIWAAGVNGTILHHDGSTWQEISVGPGIMFRAISGLGGYAVGDDGVVFKNNPVTGWTDLGLSNVSPWNDIDAVSSTEIYAANGDTLMRWGGDDWRPFANNFNEITSLHAVSSDRIWITSRSADGWDNFVQVWTGNMFNMSHHSSMDPFNSIWCDVPGDTIMVAADNGYVFRNGGVAWEWLTADPARKHFYDLDGRNAHDIFAVGSEGMIAHFNGASWKIMNSGVTDTLRAISGSVAVGDNGAVTRWDGSQWKAEDSGTTANLNAVCFIDGKEAWAVGDGGVIISNDGGGEWTLYERSLYTIDLKTVWGHAANDIWFGGETGYLLRYQP